MTGMARAHPPELRAAAIAHAVAHGVTAAARQYDVFPSTVCRWMKAAGVATMHPEQTAAALEAELARRTVVREEVRTLFLEKAADMLLRMDEPHIEFKGNGAQQVEYPEANASDCRAYAVAAAILIDKYRLEVGESTDRTEVVGERERLLADADARALRLVEHAVAV